jgi:prepilin-type processing-associated H-X9-DG protein
MTCDGFHAATTYPSVTFRDASWANTFDNIAYTPNDIDYSRHNGVAIASYVDGHVDASAIISMGTFLMNTDGLIGDFSADNPTMGFPTDMVAGISQLSLIGSASATSLSLSPINGLPAVHFDGTGGYSLIANAGNVFSAFAVYRATARTPSNTDGSWFQSSAIIAAPNGNSWYNDTILQYNNSLNNVNISFGNGFPQNTNTTLDAYNAPLNTVHLLGFTGSQSVGIYSGTLLFDGNTQSITSSGYNNNFNTITIGCLNGGNNNWQYFIGDISEVVIYNKVLTASQIADVQNYLTTKYGIYQYFQEY